MTALWATALLYANLASHAALLAGALWCIAFPARRIYPMTSPNAWYYAMWALFGFIFVTNPLFVLLDWNTGLWASPIRFWLAGPLVILGGGLVSWGMATLGSKRTSGLVDGLIAEGPYLFTRNPQYVGRGFNGRCQLRGVGQQRDEKRQRFLLGNRRGQQRPRKDTARQDGERPSAISRSHSSISGQSRAQVPKSAMWR